MKEQLISFETAKLAREKGFPFNGSSIYKVVNILQDSLFGTLLTSQSLLQKWLREKHNIHIIIRPGFGDPFWYDYIIEPQTFVAESSFNSYEEALEEALQKALNLIK